MVQSLGAYFIFYVLTIKLITCVQEKSDLSTEAVERSSIWVDERQFYSC